MTYKNSMGIFPYKTASHISLLNPHCSRPSAHPLQLCVNFLKFRHAAHKNGPFLGCFGHFIKYS